MPDFNIEIYWLCETANSWETQVGTHTVRWCYQPGGPAQYDYECVYTKDGKPCPGFRFRGTCSHVEQAKQQHCKWHQFMDGGEPEDGRCPRCGGPVTAERWAV